MKRLVRLAVALTVTCGLVALLSIACKPQADVPIGAAATGQIYRTRTTISPVSPGTTGAFHTVNSGGINGYLVAVYIDYGATMSNTTDITLSYTSPASGNILTKADNVTDGWFYPRALAQSTAAANATDAWVMLPVDGVIQCTISQTLSGTTGYVDFYWVRP